MRKLVLLLVLLVPAWSQIPLAEVDNGIWFSASKTSTLAATAEKLTLQHSGTSVTAPNVKLYLYRGEIYCSVACTVTLSKAGTAATTTALTPVALNHWTDTTDPVAWGGVFSASNVGAGTTIRTMTLVAGETRGLDLEGLVLETGTTSVRNFSIGIAALTGDVTITLKWRQR